MVISSVVDVATGVTATHTGISEPSSPESTTFTKLNAAIQREIIEEYHKESLLCSQYRGNVNELL